MRSAHHLGLLLLVLLAAPACGLVSVPLYDASRDARADASEASAAPDASAPDSAMPSLCDGLPELASAANLQPDGGYELATTATADRWDTSCTAQRWEHGQDTAVRFTAPSAGRWYFHSVGGSLWSFSGASTCEPRAAVSPYRCQEFTSFHDTDTPFATPLHFTARLAQGEVLYLVSDGCQGTGCTFRLRAQLTSDNGCFDADSTCAAGQLCLPANGDNTGPGACVQGTAPSLTSGAVYASEAGAALRGQAYDAQQDVSRLLFELYDVANVLVPFQGRAQSEVDAYADSSGRVSAVLSRAALPAGAFVARVWLRDSTGLESPALRLRLEAPPTLGPGLPCDSEGLASRCVEGAFCVGTDRNPGGECTAEHAASLTRVTASVDHATDQLLLVLEGTDPDLVATDAELLFLDAAGEPAAEPLVTGCTLQAASGPSGFTGTVALRYSALGRGLRSVRVTLRDSYGLRSNTVEAPMP